jgi:hypothetical protein
MQLRNLSPETIKGYVGYVAQFARHFGRSPEVLTPEHAREYQLHLLRRKASWSTFTQSICALRCQPRPRQTTGPVPAIARCHRTCRCDIVWRTSIPRYSRRRLAPLSPLRPGRSEACLANLAAPCSGTGGQHLPATALRQFVMTLVPGSAMWSWLPRSLPRVVLIARLSQKTRPNVRHDRHLRTPVASLFRPQLPRLNCPTRAEMSRTHPVVIALPIQAP